jgi:hypothetical protein
MHPVARVSSNTLVVHNKIEHEKHLLRTVVLITYYAQQDAKPYNNKVLEFLLLMIQVGAAVYRTTDVVPNLMCSSAVPIDSR